MLKHNSTAYIGEGIKLFNERDAVCYKDSCFGWKQPIRSNDIVYPTVRIDIHINKFFVDSPKIWRATWLSTAARQSSRRTLLLVSTIVNVKEESLTDLHVHTRPAPEKFELVVLRSAIHIRQKKIHINKKHEPLFLSQIRTRITESNKSTYPFLQLQSYRHEVTVPNPVQEHNLNVLFICSASNDNTCTMNRPSMTKL